MNDSLSSQKLKRPRSVTDNVMIALRKIIQAIDLNSRNLIKRFGLSGPQLVILKEIARFDEMQSWEQILQGTNKNNLLDTGII